MKSIMLMDKKIVIAENESLDQVLSSNGYTGTYFAVAINRQFIPRIRYMTTLLMDGDHIDIISPMQGG